MASNDYSAVVQLLAKQIVEATKNVVGENNRTYIPSTLSGMQISADMISGDISTSKLREFDLNVGRIAQAKIDNAQIDAAQIVNLRVDDAHIVNLDAGKITSGQINTELVKIFAGDDISFVWNADGIYAYEIIDGVINPQSFARFNKDGVLMQKNGRTILRQSWEGFYLGSLDGSIELNAEEGLIVYDRPLGTSGDTRKPLIKLGKYTEGDVTEYGLRFYKTVDGETTPTLTADSNGDLWLDSALTVGNILEEGTIVIDGASKSIGTVTYASGALGNGWRIEGDGSATFNNVYVRGTIAASVFEYDKISSVGGSLYVAPTLISTQKSVISVVEENSLRHYQIELKHGFSGEEHNSAGTDWGVNDVVSMQGFIENGNTVYDVTDMRFIITGFTEDGCTLRSLNSVHYITVGDADPGSINLEGMSVAKDASFIYLGTANGNTLQRRGIFITANDKHGPYIDVYDSTENDNNPKVRLGKLTGISDPRILDGRTLSGYGLYAQDAYLTGTIVANQGNIAGWQINDNTLETEGGTVGLGDGSAESRVGDYVIWAGNATPDNAPFSVKKDGTVKASLLDLSQTDVIENSVENAIDRIIADGVEVGSQNYVQTTMPTEYKQGDTWQDSSNKYKLYVAKGETGVPEVDWVPVSTSQISGSVLYTDADTGQMVIGSGKSLSIAANGVIDLQGGNAVNIGSGGTISMNGSKLYINADDLIIEGNKSLSVAIGDAMDEVKQSTRQVFVQLTEPDSEGLKEGDIWVKCARADWAFLQENTWDFADNRVWNEIYADESTQCYVWECDRWVMISDVETVRKQGTQLEMTDERITLLAFETQQSIDELDGEIDSVKTAVQEITPEYIVSTVTDSTTYKNDINDLSDDIQETKTAVQKITADYIINTVTSSKVYTDDIDGLEASINQTNSAVQKITPDYIVNTVTSSETYTTLDAQVNSNADAIADTNRGLTTLVERVSSAEHKITADAIVSTVTSSTTYKTLDQQVANNTSGINTTNNNLSALTTRVNNAEQKITDEAIISTVSSTYSTKAQAQGYATTAKNDAIADTTNKLKNYSTTEQMNSAITQKADSITSTVSKTYSTKTEAQGYADTAKSGAITQANSDTDAKLKSYSTTAQMNSAITQSANSITSTVSETYSTKAQAQQYATNAKNDAISDTTNKLKNYSTTTQMNSAIEQRANSISLRVEEVAGIAGATPTTVKNSSVVIDTSGVAIKTGGTFTVDSKKFDINANGEMSATNVVISGKVQVDGYDVWNKGDLIVSTATPASPRNNMIWVKPDTSSIPAAGEWMHEQLDARPFTTTTNLELSGVSIGAAPSNATYTYEVKVPIYHSFSNTTGYNCTVYLGATSGAKTITVGTQTISKQGGDVYTFSTTSSTWLGNSSKIYLTVVFTNPGGYVSVDSYTSFSCKLTAKSNSGGTGWKNCTVQMYVQ